MNNNLKKSVIEAIAETQDGHLKSLRDNDDFSKFILARVDENTHDEIEWVDIESLVTDFEYMISQLKSALKPLQKWEKDHPDREIDPNTKYYPMTDEMLKDLLG